jgi:hypothetical protein
MIGEVGKDGIVELSFLILAPHLEATAILTSS